MTDSGRTQPITSGNGSVELPSNITLPPSVPTPEPDATHTPTEKILSRAIGAGHLIRLKEKIINARTGMGTFDPGTPCLVMHPPEGTVLVGVRPLSMEDERRWFYVRLDEIDLAVSS